MISAMSKRILSREGFILLLTVIALGCLPIALTSTVRDAALSLLLPVTLFSFILMCGLAKTSINQAWLRIIVLIIGPIALFVHVGQLGADLIQMPGQLLMLFSTVPAWLNEGIRPDATALITVSNEFGIKVLTLSERLYFWVRGFWHGEHVEAIFARALVWGIGLWLASAWAGWKINRNGRVLAGLLPSTFLLAFVVDYTGKQQLELWVHLGALLLLLGLVNYESHNRKWKSANVDYSDSTALDTLGASSILATGLVFFAVTFSSFSLKDFIDQFREPEVVASSPRELSLGLEAQEIGRVVGRLGTGYLPREHLLGTGPELSHQRVMTIETGDLPPMPEQAHPDVPRYYWRTLTYETYIGSGWANFGVSGYETISDESLLPALPAHYRHINQHVVFSGQPDGRLYWTGALLGADVPLKIAWHSQASDNPGIAGNDPFMGADILGAISSATSYHAESLLLQATVKDLREAPPVYPDWVTGRYLQLPDSIPARVLSLARDLTAASPTQYDRAMAIESHLRQIPYTLEVSGPPRGRDAADYFLFDLEKGYCDYYATAMVVLARAAGLPARFVTGYASGTYDTESARYFVTAADAHSWAEIYFSGIGWVEFEPTASQPEMFRAEQTDEQPSAPPIEEGRTFSQITAQFFAHAIESSWLQVSAVALLFLLWIGTDSLRLNLLNPPQAIERLYRRLLRLARPLSGSSPIGQTIHEYEGALTNRLKSLDKGHRLSHAYSEIHSLTDFYSRSLFAPSIPTRIDLREAVRIWSRLKWRLLLANLILFGRKSSRRAG